jgi:hypothetical protein
MRATPFDQIPHGTARGRNHYGCACEPCREAWRKARKTWELQRHEKAKRAGASVRESQSLHLRGKAAAASQEEKVEPTLTDGYGDDWTLVPASQIDGERVWRRGRLVERESYIRAVWGIRMVQSRAIPILNEQSGV